jgi:inorganic pyrophosphatase
MCHIINNGIPTKLVLENRPKMFKFGVRNYGEIPGLINRADKDPWDVIVPGYPSLEIGVPYYIKKLDGVFMLPNGNHKLIVDVECKHKRNRTLMEHEINEYQRRYNNFTRLNGHTVLY